jgi:hypothetical protein
MTPEVFDILQKKRFRLFPFQNLHNIEEKCALSLILEAMRSSKTFLLANTGKTERLTWESSQKDVVVGDEPWVNLGNVVGDIFAVREIGFVGSAGVSIPLAAENAPSIQRLKASPQPTNSGKQINESEVRLTRAIVTLKLMTDRSQIRRTWHAFPDGPPPDCSFSNTQHCRKVILRPVAKCVIHQVSRVLIAGNHSGQYVRFSTQNQSAVRRTRSESVWGKVCPAGARCMFLKRHISIDLIRQEANSRLVVQKRLEVSRE